MIAAIHSKIRNCECWYTRSCDKIEAGYVFSAAGILLVTGLAKLVSAIGKDRILNLADPVLGVHIRYLIFMVGLLEMVISAIGFLSHRKELSLILLAWLATNFTIYRVGLRYIGWPSPCHCMGTITDALHISPQVGDLVMRIVLLYLILGSFGLLVLSWFCRRRAQLGPIVSAASNQRKT